MTLSLRVVRKRSLSRKHLNKVQPIIESGYRVFVQLQFTIPLTILSSLRWSSAHLNRGWFGACGRVRLQVTDCGSHVRRIMIRIDGKAEKDSATLDEVKDVDAGMATMRRRAPCTV